MTQNISVTMRDRGLVTIDHLQETTHCKSYDHVTDEASRTAMKTFSPAMVERQWDKAGAADSMVAGGKDERRARNQKRLHQFDLLETLTVYSA